MPSEPANQRSRQLAEHALALREAPEAHFALARLAEAFDFKLTPA